MWAAGRTWVALCDLVPEKKTDIFFDFLGRDLVEFEGPERCFLARNRQETCFGNVPIPRSLAQLQIAAENGHLQD